MFTIVPFSKNRVVLNVTYYVTFPPKNEQCRFRSNGSTPPLSQQTAVRVGIR